MRDLPESGVEPVSSALAGGFFYHWASREALKGIIFKIAGLAPLKAAIDQSLGPVEDSSITIL